MRDKTDIRFKEKAQTVGIFGLGYVGLPLSLTFCRAGLQVIGFDIDSGEGRYFKRRTFLHSTYRTGRHSRSGKRYTLRATTDFSELIHCDCLVICVPTPLTNSRKSDLSFVENTAKAIAPYLRKGQLFCLENAHLPTTEEIIRPILETSGLRAGEDFHLAYSPEREDPGNKEFST